MVEAVIGEENVAKEGRKDQGINVALCGRVEVLWLFFPEGWERSLRSRRVGYACTIWVPDPDPDADAPRAIDWLVVCMLGVSNELLRMCVLCIILYRVRSIMYVITEIARGEGYLL